MSNNGVSLDGYEGYMSAWSPTLSDIADLNQALPLLDGPTTGDQIQKLESSVEQLKRQIKALKKELRDIQSAVRDAEDWRHKFSDWGESLMSLIWGDEMPEERALQITELQGWIEESPV